MPSRDLKKKAIPRFRSEKQEREFWSKHDVPYQTLLKIFLAERVREELREV